MCVSSYGAVRIISVYRHKHAYMLSNIIPSTNHKIENEQKRKREREREREREFKLEYGFYFAHDLDLSKC